MADVAQMEAQQASDAYNLTHQQNLYETAMLTLKQKMNFPIEEALLLDTCLLEQSTLEQEQLTIEHADNVFRLALNCNPVLKQAEMQKQSANMDRKISWSSFVPSISLYGGISSSYYKELHQTGYPPFHTQFENNFGSYFGISMSIPIFNRLSGIANMRQARNNYRIATEQYEAQKEELQKLVQQAVQDREGYLKEVSRWRRSSFRLTGLPRDATQVRRRLMTSLDVQNNAATLLESQTGLLQSKLTYLMKCRLVDYYKGQDIIRNNE